MTDPWGPDRDGPDGPAWETTSGGAPPPPPPRPPAASRRLDIDDLTTVTVGAPPAPRRPRWRGERAIAALVGVLLVAGGTAFAVTQLGGSGPASPEAAVDELLAAASDEDVLGMLAALDPYERDAMVEPITRLFEELERLEVVEGLDLRAISGLDISFEDVTYRVEPVRDGLARVHLTGGTVTTGVVAEELPIGDFVADTLERFDVDISDVSESDTSPVVDDDVFIVARESADGWRVSIGYTIAEYARLDAGLLVDGLTPVTPIGADSPEEAVRGLAEAAAALDVEGVIARLSPRELGPLQEYAGLFLADVQAAVDDADDDVEIELRDLALDPRGSGDRATVLVSGFDLSVTSDGSTLDVQFEDGCVTLTGDLEPYGDEMFPGMGDGPLCPDDVGAMYSEMFTDLDLEGIEEQLEVLQTIGQPEVGITTVRVDGRWYVAPVSMGFDALVALLEVIERSHLDAMVDIVEWAMESFEDGFSEVGTVLPGQPTDEEVPTTIVDPLDGAVPVGALQDLVGWLAPGDSAMADCLFVELSRLETAVLGQLVDAIQRGYEPSIEVQESYFTVLETCSYDGGNGTPAG